MALAWTLMAAAGPAAVRREELLKILLYSSTSNVTFLTGKVFRHFWRLMPEHRGTDVIGMEALGAGMVCVPVSPPALLASRGDARPKLHRG